MLGQFPTFEIHQSRERRDCGQEAKTERRHVRERNKGREKKTGGDLTQRGGWGAFPLALTGEINHRNYGSAQVNGDRSPLSFPSSRCFLLI